MESQGVSVAFQMASKNSRGFLRRLYAVSEFTSRGIRGFLVGLEGFRGAPELEGNLTALILSGNPS